MKKLALNAIVLGVFGSAFVLTSCDLFGSKAPEKPVEKVNDSITANNDSLKIDSLTSQSIEMKDSVAPNESTVKEEVVSEKK